MQGIYSWLSRGFLRGSRGWPFSGGGVPLRPDIQHNILTEQKRTIFRQLPVQALGASLGTLIVILLLWDAVDHGQLVLWGVASLALNFVACIVLYGFYVRLKDEELVQFRWTFLLHVLVFSCGTVWGITGVVFYTPESLVHQLLLAIWLFGIAALTTLALNAHRSIYYLYIIPLLIPFCIRVLQEDDLLHRGIGIAGFVHILLLIGFHASNYKMYTSALELKFINQEISKRLIEEKNRAEKSSRDKSRFMAAASHDLRQPLHAQVLFISDLEANAENDAQRKTIQNLSSSIDEMRKLLDNILDVARLDAGVVTAKKVHCPLAGVLRQMQEEFAPLAVKQGLDFRVRISPEIIYSDPFLLGQVLRNLLANAIRYTRSGGVLLGLRRQDNGFRLEVWDTGIGIPEAMLDKIFFEFHQLGNEERNRDKGVGLGLSIVKRISRLLGSEVSVKSMPGKGSVFSLTLEKGDASQVRPADVEDVLVGDGSLEGKQVWVIDDDLPVLMGMEKLLLAWGCRVHLADGQEQVDGLLDTLEEAPDLIISDYRLPGRLTGSQLVERILEEIGKPVPAIIVTGDTAADRLAELQASGFRVLHKPVKTAQLRALMEHELRTLRQDTKLP